MAKGGWVIQAPSQETRRRRLPHVKCHFYGALIIFSIIEDILGSTDTHSSRPLTWMSKNHPYHPTNPHMKLLEEELFLKLWKIVSVGECEIKLNSII